MSMHTDSGEVPAGRTATSLGATFVILAILLFWPAGNWAWRLGWTFLIVFGLQIGVALVWLRQANPEIFAARQSIGPNTKAWDFVLMPLVMVFLIAILPIAAFDNARFAWSAPPFAAILLGYGLFIAGFWLMAWAQAVNRYFEPSVRIQTERNHTVVETGPYAYVRHPGYVAASLLAFGWALSLGSNWAQLPALLTTLTLIVRTELEDRMLQAELPGYADYARSVKAKWIPGVY